MTSSRLDPRQIVHVNGREVILPARVCKFEVGADGIELTDEEIWWLLYGDAYQRPPDLANNSLLSHKHGLSRKDGGIKRSYGRYEELLRHFEELRTQIETMYLILTKDGYIEQLYDSKQRYTLIYDADQKHLTIEAKGQTVVRPWNPPPRRSPGYRPAAMPDLQQIKIASMA